MILTHEHQELRRSLRRFVETEIDPFADAWEEAEIFPAHELFKKAGAAGFLGICKPVEFGGLGLDYSYSLVAAEEWGRALAGGVATALGVQTDMATPALAKHGSDALRREFLAPAIAGEQVACIGVSEEGAGSDVASIRTKAVRDGDDYVITGSKMWITNGDAGRLDVPARQYVGRSAAPQQVSHHRADEIEGRDGRAKTAQARPARLGHRADLLRRGARAGAQPHRRGRPRLRLPDGAVPGGAALCGRQGRQHAGDGDHDHCGIYAGATSVRHRR